MRRLTRSVRHLTHSDIAVDDSIPRGYAHVSYNIPGFNTAHNPLVPPINGFRPVQTNLSIVFESGTRRAADGVTVEDVLAVCEDHLNTKRSTLQGSEAHARAAAHIRRAVEELISTQKAFDSLEDTNSTY